MTREFAGFTAYTGGIGTQFASTAVELARQGHEVHVLCGAPQQLSVFTSQHPDIKFREISLRHNRIRVTVLRELRWSLAFRRELRRLGSFDVIYAPEWRGWAATYLIGKHTTPVVTTLASTTKQVREANMPGGVPVRKRYEDLLTDALEWLQVVRSEGVAPTSKSLEKASKKTLNHSRGMSKVIPLFLDPTEVKRLADNPLASEMQDLPPYAVLSGRVNAWKGAAVLARALPEIFRNSPDLHLVFVGTVNELEDGKRADDVLLDAAGSHRDQLHFLGHRSREEMMPVVKGSIFAIFPSVFEGFGLGALEAKMLDKAVVVTADNGFSEFCVDGQNALLVPIGDSSALAKAVNLLVSSTSLRESLEKGGADLAQRFSPEPVVRELSAFMQKIVDVEGKTKSVAAASRGQR